jgi:hypothetical protein
MERYRTDRPDERPNPKRMVEIRWTSGKRMLLASKEINFVLNAANRGEIPYYEKGAATRLLADDGSKAWEKNYQEALKGPLML